MSFGDALFTAFMGVLALVLVGLVGYAIYLAPIIGVVLLGVAFVVATAAAVIYKVSNQ